MPEDTIIDGETGDPLVDTEPPAAPEWPGQVLEVIELTDGTVFFHEPCEDAEYSIQTDRATLRDLGAWL